MIKVYWINYLIEYNGEDKDYECNDNSPYANEAGRNLSYNVPHLLAPQFNII